MDDAQLCRTCLKENNLHQNYSLYNFDFNFFQVNIKSKVSSRFWEKKNELAFEINDAHLLLISTFSFNLIYNLIKIINIKFI